MLARIIDFVLTAVVLFGQVPSFQRDGSYTPDLPEPPPHR